MSKRPMIVVAHACERARERYRIDGTYQQIEAYIAAEVRDALTSGRVLNHKPKHWRLYGEKGHNLDRGERFVWNADDDRAWIVKRTPTEDVVVTTLNRTGVSSRVNRVAQMRR